MAFETGNIPQETLDYLASRAQPKSSKGAVLTILVLLTLSLIVVIRHTASGNAKGSNGAEPVSAKANATALPYAPKKLIDDAVQDLTKKDFHGALADISELQDADRKRPKVLGIISQANRGLEITTARNAKTARLEYAKDFETNRLEAGEDYVVRAQGPNADSLSLTYVFINRPYVYNMQKDAAVREKWSALGFKQVRLSDGFGASWSYRLK